MKKKTTFSHKLFVGRCKYMLNIINIMYEKHRYFFLPDTNWSQPRCRLSWVEGTICDWTKPRDCWKCSCVTAVRRPVAKKIQSWCCRKEKDHDFQPWRSTFHDPNRLSRGIPRVRHPENDLKNNTVKIFKIDTIIWILYTRIWILWQ